MIFGLEFLKQHVTFNFGFDQNNELTLLLYFSIYKPTITEGTATDSFVFFFVFDSDIVSGFETKKFMVILFLIKLQIINDSLSSIAPLTNKMAQCFSCCLKGALFRQ